MNAHDKIEKLVVNDGWTRFSDEFFDNDDFKFENVKLRIKLNGWRDWDIISVRAWNSFNIANFVRRQITSTE